ncbi:MAG: DHH family phosphoesterase [Nanobdellota archaeon]
MVVKKSLFSKEKAEIDNYISSLKNKRAIICFDDDPDGICSGIIIKKYLEKKGFKIIKNIALLPENDLFGKEFSDMVKKEDIDLVVVTDFNVSNFGLSDNYNSFIKDNPELRCLMFDHHIDNNTYDNALYYNSCLIQKHIEGSQYCCSKLVFDLLNDEGEIEEISWISAIGVIGDFNAKTWNYFLKEEIDKENKNRLRNKPDSKTIPEVHSNDEFFETPFGKASNLIFYGVAMSKKEAENIFDNIDKCNDINELNNFLKKYGEVEEEIKDYIENYEYFIKNADKKIEKEENTVFEVEVKSQNNICSVLANSLSKKDYNTIFFIYQKTDNGYHISTRLQNGKKNLGKIMNDCAVFEESYGGGHAEAAGAFVKKEYFNDFKNKFFELLEGKE